MTVEFLRPLNGRSTRGDCMYLAVRRVGSGVKFGEFVLSAISKFVEIRQ